MTLVLVLVAAWLVAQAPSAPPQSLSANLPVRAMLAGGERVQYSIDVPAGHAARIVVRQEGIDVTLRVARRGEPMPISSVDFRAGLDGEERQHPPVLDVTTTWEIRITAALPRAARGEYVVVADVAPADETARILAAGRALMLEAQEAITTSDAAGLRRGQERFTAAAAAGLADGDTDLAAEATFQRARTHDQLGDQPVAIEWQLRALELFRTLGQVDRQGRVLNRLGDLSRKIGAVGDAENYFAQALPLAQSAHDPSNVADILNNSGLLLLATSRPEEAIAQLEAAIPLARELNSASIEVALLNNISEAHRNLGMYEKAIDSSLSAAPAVARLNIPRRSARTLLTLGMAYFESGDSAKAEDTITRSIDIYRVSGDQVGLADALAQQARMMHASGESDRAVAAFAKVRPLLEQAQNRSSEAALLASWANVEIDRGEYAPALAKLDEAIALSRSIANRYTETRSGYLRAVALQKLDRLDEAVGAIKGVIDEVETMRGSMARSDLRTSYLAAVHAYYDLYVDLLQQRGDAAGAFEVSERARARTLLEGLAESAAKIEKGVDAALLARQRAVQRELNAKEIYRAEVALRDGERSPSARKVAADVERLLEQWTSLRAQIRSASPAFAALQQPQPITVKELQSSLLDAGTVMVAYHLGAARGYAWVIDRQSIVVQPLPGLAAIDPVARRYHAALSREIDALGAADRDTVAAEARAAGRELAALVWKPIESRVRGKRLLVVADRALHYVPFAALPTASGAPIIVNYEVVYLPSASVLATLRRDSRPVSAGAATAVFADPVFSKDDPRLAVREPTAPAPSRSGDAAIYGRLRFSRREAEAISTGAPGVFQALDFSATKSAALSKTLKQYRILHFATHGSLDTEHPDLSGLVFSLVDRAGKPVDGFLRLHEIYNLDLDADLVVLSACRTALGREVHGEGLIGLTRGFMYAGASRVVSSVWNIDDRASALLMARFYDAMRTKHLAPAAALRDAQLSLVNDPRWSNPHYWAAFGLQGEWK